MENTEEVRSQIEADLGLDKPIHIQYIQWISNIVFRGDLGKSLMRETSVSNEIASRLPVTFWLGSLAILFALVIAIPIGVYSALYQDTLGDHIGRSVAILGLAIPSFLVRNYCGDSSSYTLGVESTNPPDSIFAKSFFFLSRFLYLRR